MCWRALYETMGKIELHVVVLTHHAESLDRPNNAHVIFNSSDTIVFIRDSSDDIPHK